ncbi:MAG: Ig-like domain-containing protein, partial [Moorella sp. (in: Bacteria)]|nr:Ig-like domain-containing protein [Moorella sp. (in: firmicutes)]
MYAVRGRKNWSRLLAVLLAIMMVVGILPVWPMGAGQAEAAETGQVIINEFGQGTSGNSFEWVELVVVGAGPGSTVDMRGWDLGDTTPGDLSFTNDDKWSAVPAGTIIVIYNNVTGKTSNFPTDDLDFGNDDFNAVIPHNNSTLFSGNWGALNNSGGDAIVLRDALGRVVDGVSYGSDTTQTPQLSLVGSAKAACYNGGYAAGVNTAGNWSIIDDGANPATTPGAGNNDANTSWINSLRSGGGGGGGDTTPPALVSATVNGNQLVLNYNEALDNASVPDAVYFTVKVNGQAQAAPASVSISGTQVTLTLAAAVNAGDTVTVSYTRGDNPIQDTSGNDAAEFTDQVVTNNTPAAALTVSAARVAANGTTVTTRGEVTAVLGTSAWMQDSTAGIRLYGGNITSVQVGQEVEVTGTVKDYNGDREIEVSSYTVLSGDNFPTPTPIAVTIDQVGEANEGQLIKIENAWIVSDYTSGSGGVYITTDGTNRLLVYAQAGAEMKTYLQGLPKGDNNKFNFTGISSCYNTTRELFPRTTGDIQAVGGGPDTTPPAVSGKNPAENATGVALDAEVSVTFNESVVAGTYAGDITIKDASNQSVSGVTYAFSGTKLTINHPDFAPSTAYTVTVPAGAVRDAAGNETTQAITWSFTTGSGGSAPGATPINQVDGVGADGQPTRLNEDNVTIEGIALVGKGVLDAGRTIYVQDATGGIALYAGGGLPAVAQGDRVRVTGKVAFYKGLTELSPGSSPQFLTVLSSGNPLPSPRDTALSELTAFNTAEPLEGTLVQVEAEVSSVPPSPDSGGGYNVKITDANGGNEIILRVMTTTGINPASALQVGKTYTITGIVGQYDSSSPYTSGYEIFPRAASDIVEKQAVADDAPVVYNAHPAPMAFTYNRR